MKEKNFEDIFKDKLSHFEADVNPSVWQSVQSGLAGKGAAVSGASGASQAASTFAGLGAKGMMWIAAAALVTGAGLYYVLGDRSQATVEKAAVNNPTQVVTVPVEKQVTENQQSAISASENAKIAESKPAPPFVDKEVPASTDNKTQQAASYTKPDVSATPPDAPPASTPAENQKQEELPAAPGKTDELQGTVKSTQGNEASVPPWGTIESGVDKPVFDLIENYLLVASNGEAALPNNFTPDGDGYNDVFTLHTTGLKSLEVTIFSHDAVVAKWNGLDGSWNGLLSNGKAAKAGTYYYSVKAVTEEGKICIAQSSLVLAR